MKRVIVLLFPYLIVYILFPIISVGQTSISKPFSFSLAQKARTSAGVFAQDGTLIRTLWSGAEYPSGSHTQTWDGLDDQGRMAPDATYKVKVLSNNVTYTWEGVIGNSSFGVSQGNAIQRGFLQIQGMAITGNTAYYGVGYAEGHPSQAKSLLTSPQSKVEFFPKGETAQATRFVAADKATVYWAGYDGYSNGKTWFVFATRVSDDTEKPFEKGISCRMELGRVYKSCLDIGTTPNSAITGLAVQQNGNYLFVAHQLLNKLHVFDKTTGGLVQTLPIDSPRGLAIDGQDNLWVINGTNSVNKYIVQTNGTLSAATLALSGLE
ncbi:FlgD immunoglobulin-like domain containing protein, partial [Spirosoma soli]